MNKKGNNCIQLNESDLTFLVENAVKSYLMENQQQEGFFGGMRNAFRTIGNGNFNLSKSYSSGSWASSFNSYYNTAAKALNGMIKVMQKSGDYDSVTSIQQIMQNLKQVSTNYNQMAYDYSSKSNDSGINNFDNARILNKR